MNNFLADLLGLINGVLALIVVLLGAGAGAYYGQDQINFVFNPVGAVLGACLGVLVASIVFGTLAILISIRRELRQLNRSLLRGPNEPNFR